MTHPSKRKSNTHEREVVNLAKSMGLNAKRAYASNGESLGLDKEVDCVIAGIKAQCKRRKSLAVYLKPPETCDIAIIREDRGVNYVVIPLRDYFELLGGVL